MATETARPTLKPRGETALSEQFVIDFNRPVPGAGAGLPAFSAREQPGGGVALVALQLRPEQPPPPGPLQRLAPPIGAIVIPGVMTPLAHGTRSNPAGQEHYYVICTAPPGASLADNTAPWSEDDLIEGLLRPAAAALDRLAGLGVTHRSIRPDNMFRAGVGASVMLGCGWAVPPALHQPSVYEPPYSAMCVPGGRAAGHIGDDVYALGIALITLARGRPPLAGLDDDEIIRRKLDMGCHAAVTAEGRLPPSIVELTRGMLAEDPEYRTTPAILTDPMAARTRRPAVRPVRRGLRPLDIGGIQAWNGRVAAFAIARNPDIGVKLLRSGEVDQWLRRNLGDVGMAGRLDEVVRQKTTKEDGKTDSAAQALLESRSDTLTAMRAVVAFDPLAPLCWRGTALWPAALGSALAVAQAASLSGGEQSDASAAANVVGHIEEIISGEVVGRWAELRADRCDAALLRMDARQHRNWHRQRGAGGGLSRVSYGLNPLQRCGSPLLATRYVTTPIGLLNALEDLSKRPEMRRGPPLDSHIAAFIAARVDLPSDLLAGTEKDPVAAALVPLRVLAALQSRLRAPSLPGLGHWLADSAPIAIEAFSSRSRRTQLTERLAGLARKGDLSELLRALDDAGAREADAAALARAKAEVARLDTLIANTDAAMEGRSEEARRIGQEVCVGVGMVSLVVSIGLVAL